MSDKIGATSRNRTQGTRAAEIKVRLGSDLVDRKVSDLNKLLIRDGRHFIKLLLSMNHYKITYGNFLTIRAAKATEKFCHFNLTASQ